MTDTHKHYNLIPRPPHPPVLNSLQYNTIRQWEGLGMKVYTHCSTMHVSYPPPTHNTHTHTYIHRLESLLPLAGLVHLKNLSLKIPGTELTNPVCSIVSYEVFMQDTFPLLIWLDGEKVSGPGSEFYSRYAMAWNGGINLLVLW